MAEYSKEDKEEFKRKDLRICRQAILKSLIESGKVGVNEVLENCQIAEQYVDYIYNGLSCKKEKKQETKTDREDWSNVAKNVETPIPTTQNIKVLDAILAEYKKRNDGEEFPRTNLLVAIHKKFGKYPVSVNSVETILKTLK